ncbi:hypothetical protein E4I92_14365 [Escherichia coli]|uniref:NTF2 fold immunity protein n=1 Tax=Escherichia coli TaxID=562 RepID=UPI00182CFA81|nr:NTF2 fold immunity protein [Escherichia coli]EFB7642809.1 hypothetical protein [Escherichia coli]EGB0858740.1 hypothetical protein [Escherichia coli]
MITIFLFLALFIPPAISQESANPCYSENKNYEGKYLINNEEMVKKLTEIYVTERYGKDSAQREKPYNISNKEGAWQISGSIDPNATGGVFMIEIDKTNGRIISFTHGK